ncbi:hypothetical protein KCP73_23830 [Salmonella enterica subsp. enterica]|nr:hypothetical protein KCP73_23830 [Salmonella enterica subsp. enterica]
MTGRDYPAGVVRHHADKPGGWRRLAAADVQSVTDGAGSRDTGRRRNTASGAELPPRQRLFRCVWLSGATTERGAITAVQHVPKESTWTRGIVRPAARNLALFPGDKAALTMKYLAEEDRYWAR